jgi:hypothetical protein
VKRTFIEKVQDPVFSFLISFFILYLDVAVHFITGKNLLDFRFSGIEKSIVDLARDNLIKYVNEVGLREEASAINIAPISILSNGHVHVADTINCSRSEGLAEITFHAFYAGSGCSAGCQKTDRQIPPCSVRAVRHTSANKMDSLAV